MQLYYGTGMQIMLPKSYISEDIDSALPTIIATIKDFVGGESGPLSGLVDSIEGNIGWYGYDGGTAAVYPTRLIILRNKAFSKLPVSMITMGLEQVLGGDAAMVDKRLGSLPVQGSGLPLDGAVPHHTSQHGS
jgi:hypothetical protein